MYRSALGSIGLILCGVLLYGCVGSEPTTRNAIEVCTGEDCEEGNGDQDSDNHTNLCAEVVCETPPEALCEGNTAVSFETDGWCVMEEGAPTCRYRRSFDNCTYRLAQCSAGQCEGGIEQSSQVVVVEYMARPRGFFGGAGQWMEIINNTGSPLQLDGWRLESSLEGEEEVKVHLIEGSATVPAGSRVLLAGSSDPAGDGSVMPDYRWNRNEFTIPDFAGWFRLVDPNDEVADFVYIEPGAIMRGHSRVLDPTLTPSAQVTNDFSNWCPNLVDVLGTAGNFGRPGSVPSPCQEAPCDFFGCELPAPYCASDFSRTYVEDSDVECQVSRFNNPWCDFNRITESCESGQLCSGGQCEATSAPLPQPGELVITELMGDPIGPDAQREWIEVYNRTDRELSLFGLRLEDNETGAAFDSYRIDDPAATIGPFQYALFVRNTDPALNGGVQNGIYYTGNHLKDSPPQGMRILLVRPDGGVVSEVHYGAPVTGVSQQLSVELYFQVQTLNPSALLNPENWCAGEGSYGEGGQGTPGAHNRACD